MLVAYRLKHVKVDKQRAEMMGKNVLWLPLFYGKHMLAFSAVYQTFYSPSVK